ncbi:unnamed protein product [Clonostachys chloroleuca]|uniref:Exonuclease domain-containing protein n=1 Tax=Clonostachys chloroleuca TaxID=1926264 RepID=A0AA35MHH9_9HYPO|nr:unnamed protein product [Clonostachys chloroleuca]
MAESTPQPIEQSPAHVRHLQNAVFSSAILRRKGYIIDPLTKDDLERKKRCSRCSKALSKKDKEELAPTKKHLKKTKEAEDKSRGASYAAGPRGDTALEGSFSLLGVNIAKGEANGASRPAVNDKEGDKTGREPLKRCRYHSGVVQAKMWTCCGKHVSAAPCCQDANHLPIQYAPGEIEANWLFHRTPQSGGRNPQQSFAIAVAIDCEMGVSDSGESELIRVTVVDYFSGAVLLDSLVAPDVRMKHYNTRFSGISRQDINEARRRRTCIFGRSNARKAIWRCVGPRTIIIGHGLNSDLLSLRWIHPFIVDTMLIEEEIVYAAKAGLPEDPDQELNEKQKGLLEISKTPLSLKSLTLLRLDRHIQLKGQGHDSVEDALASRDLLHWHLVHRIAPESSSPAPSTGGRTV